MKTLLIASAAAATLAAPAFAGSLTPAAPEPVVPAPAPAPMPVASYDWTGFYGGAQFGWGTATADDGVTEEDGDGILGGVHAGYDWDLGNYVLGVGLDYDAADIAFDNNAGSIDSVARARLRAGYDAGSWLIYGVGGAAHADADIGGTDYSDMGWFAGGGVEYRVNENVSVAGEALYHGFDDFDDTGVDASATTLQGRVTYRF
ncbi:outer membrane protein [Psychromarinibacter halotolerans]|uniref:Outer membrane protein n=1 Tax=Psychromarinibacter halotolerans TaxID=1775175 RepID=A0ABV7GST2_9RHOB|nr:outer membrane beta-barrel protein [Psychromarinibacter halotolerans]MAQ84666.1 hypothetical protein [Maritimibacter sp.]MAQ85510.1 hypothetical protein [Maritimibacter sp.]MDF0594474.1 outer membrane beta-barrel protein [Psychromarinibacter halotolerans]